MLYNNSDELTLLDFLKVFKPSIRLRNHQNWNCIGRVLLDLMNFCSKGLLLKLPAYEIVWTISS